MVGWDRAVAMAAGVLFLILGILGMIPGITTDGMLLGVFAVNAWVVLIYILVGALGIASYFMGWYRSYVLGASIFFLAAGILGFIPLFVTDAGLLLGFFQVNAASNVLHLLAGAATALAYFAPGLRGRRGGVSPTH